MSNAQFGGSGGQDAARHVIRLLKEAQAIIDEQNLPHVGARLQEVIEAIEEAASQ